MTYDLIIIGGGPAGVSAGVYAARKKMNALLLTDSFGGQSVVAEDIQNWIGTPHISGVAMADGLVAHLKSVGVAYKDGVRVAGVKEAGSGFEVSLEAGEVYETGTVLIASGSGRRKLGIPGENEYAGKGVFYCATCDAPLMKGKTVAVVGGGNAGVEAVIDLSYYASKIYLFVRSGVLKADPISVERIKKDPKVGILFNSVVKEVKGGKLAPYQPQDGQKDDKSVAGGGTTQINDESGKDGSRFGAGFVRSVLYGDKDGDKELKIEGLFVEIGSVPNTGIFKGLVDLNEWGEIVVDCKTKKTSRKGIWAAGDISDCLYKQNVVSMGDGAAAVLNIYDYLNKKL